MVAALLDIGNIMVNEKDCLASPKAYYCLVIVSYLYLCPQEISFSFIGGNDDNKYKSNT